MAKKSAESIGAYAYTFGSQIVFGHSPVFRTESDRTLLAHELMHVQQSGENVGVPLNSGKLQLAVDSSPQELEAQAVERTLANGKQKRASSHIGPHRIATKKQPTTIGTKASHSPSAKSPFKRLTATFNGADFVLFGDGTEILRASGQSGRPLSVRKKDANACHGSTSDSYLNNPLYVGIKDFGAIPEGAFSFQLTDMVTFSASEESVMRLAAVGEYVDPSGASLHGDWGSARAPLRPSKVTKSTCGDTSSRSGFYLHGGVMPGSSGCIDIGNSAIQSVVSLLQGFRSQVTLIVKYTAPAPTVGPVQKAAGRFMYPPGENPSIWDRIGSVLGGAEE